MGEWPHVNRRPVTAWASKRGKHWILQSWLKGADRQGVTWVRYFATEKEARDALAKTLSTKKEKQFPREYEIRKERK